MTMKTILSLIGLVLVAGNALATTQGRISPDKPAFLFMLEDKQNKHDDTRTKQWYYHPDDSFYFRTDDKKMDHYEHGFTSGLGGTGLWKDSSKGESWDDLGIHYIDEDWGHNCPLIFDPIGTGYGTSVYYFGGVAVATNVIWESVWPKIGNEHCVVTDSWPPPTQWTWVYHNIYYNPVGWFHEEVEETYTRKADTIWHFQTGGRAIPSPLNPQSVCQFSAYASKILEKRAVPPFNGAATLPIPPQNIEINHKLLEADHIMYQQLPDNVEVDVTPRVVGEDFYTFAVGASKHTLLHQTVCTAVGDPDSARQTIGIGEQVVIGFDPELSMTFPETITWSLLGQGTISPTTGSTTVLTAKKSPGSATVTAHVRDIDIRTGFGIVAPQSITVTGFEDKTSGHVASGTAMYAHTVFTSNIDPTSVSFHNVIFRENPEPSSLQFTWPNGHNTILIFERRTNESTWFLCGDSEFSDDIDPISAYPTSWLDGATSNNFSFENAWTYQYLNEAGVWIDCCSLSRKLEFDTNNHEARLTFCGKPGGWQGPF